MPYVSPHVLRTAKVSMAAVAPLVSASSLRSKSARLDELTAQAQWFLAHRRLAEAADIEREMARIREGMQ
jgi:hypothetical protein